MKLCRLFVVAICTVVFGLFGGAAWAAETIMTVKIPFEFAVEGATMPAGSYGVVVDRSRGSIALRNDSTGKITRLSVVTRLADVGRKKAYLVFDKAGGRRSLSEIHIPGTDGYALQGATGEHKHVKVPSLDR
jgi:hypothetical protein